MRGEGEGGREGCMSDEKEGRNLLLLLHKSKPDFMKIQKLSLFYIDLDISRTNNAIDLIFLLITLQDMCFQEKCRKKKFGLEK